MAKRLKVNPPVPVPLVRRDETESSTASVVTDLSARSQPVSSWFAAPPKVSNPVAPPQSKPNTPALAAAGFVQRFPVPQQPAMRQSLPIGNPPKPFNFQSYRPLPPPPQPVQSKYFSLPPAVPVSKFSAPPQLTQQKTANGSDYLQAMKTHAAPLQPIKPVPVIAKTPQPPREPSTEWESSDRAPSEGYVLACCLLLYARVDSDGLRADIG